MAHRITHQAKFDTGFLQFLQSGQFADMTIVINSKEYKAHSIILAHGSEFFNHKLKNMYIEENDKGKIIKCDFSDTQCVFPLVLEYIYTGYININGIFFLILQLIIKIYSFHSFI